MVAMIGFAVVLVAVKLGRLPIPPVPNPILVVEFVHLKVVPVTLLLKMTAATEVPLQTVRLGRSLTAGVGLIVIVKVLGRPVQFNPLLVNLGTTLIVATMGTVLVLIAVNTGKLSVPLAAKPMAGVEFVQA